MKANSDKSKQSNKATRRVLAGVLCGASVLSLVLSLVMPPISQAIANDAQTVSAEEAVMGEGSSSESTGVDSTANGGAKSRLAMMPRMARAKTPLPRDCRPTTRRPRAPRSLPIHSLLMMIITMKTLSLPSVPMAIPR